MTKKMHVNNEPVEMTEFLEHFVGNMFRQNASIELDKTCMDAVLDVLPRGNLMHDNIHILCLCIQHMLVGANTQETTRYLEWLGTNEAKQKSAKILKLLIEGDGLINTNAEACLMIHVVEAAILTMAQIAEEKGVMIHGHSDH